MQLSEYAIKRPVTTVMIFAAMVLLGYVSMQRIPLLLLPDVTEQSGMIMFWTESNKSIEEMERDFILPMEGIIAQLPGVSEIDVYYGRGRWNRIRVSFHPHADIRYRMVELDEQLNNFGRQFERNEFNYRSFIFSSSHMNTNFMEVKLKGPEDDPFFTRINIEDIESRLAQIDGISAADAWGGTEHVVDVTIDQDKLQEFGTSMYQVVQQTRNYANEPMVLGDIEEKGRRHFVRFDGQFDSPSEIEDVVVNNESRIAVRHLGEVEELYRPRSRVHLSGGQPSIEFDLEKDALSNPVETSKKVRESLAVINEEMPPGYEFVVENDQAEGIVGLIRQLAFSAMAGVALAMTILFIFIRNGKMTLIICMVIPICVLASLNSLYFAGLTFNVVTLVGLAVGVGSLIDNSIVVMENIYRHFERTRDAMKSAIRGTQEVGWAILALTITGVIVFIPILFVTDTGRGRDQAISLVQFFQEGSLAIIIPITVSMLAALMLVPMASARFFKAGAKTAGAEGNGAPAKPGRWISRIFAPIPMRTLQKGYLKLLKACLRHRVRFVLAILLVCSYTYFYSMGEVRQEVMQEPEQISEFEVNVYMTQGTKLETTLATATKVKDMIEREVPEAKEITARVEEDSAEIEVELVPASERTRNANTIKEDIQVFFDQFPGAEVTYSWRRPSGGSGVEIDTSGRGGEITIRGPEYGQLQTLGANFSEILRQIPEIRDAFTESEEGPVEYHFRLDRDKAALYQLDAAAVANAIRVGQRSSDFSTIRMNKDDDRIDIVFSQIIDEEDRKQRRKGNIEIEDEEGLTREELYELPVYSPAAGTTVPLQNLGVFEKRSVMGSVNRENRERISRIYYETMPNTDFREVESQIKALIDSYPAPAGYRMELEGRGRSWDESMGSVQFIILLGALLIYMCLAALFESLLLPLVILLSLPLSIVGIVWFFVITDTAFEPMMSGLGAIFLMGMLPNSAILMVYTARNYRLHNGYNRLRAIMTAGRHRLRPILMTVSTTVLGLIPLAISPDTVSIWVEWRADISFNWMSFARVVIGGLISSTILTLIVVPGFYLIVDDAAAFVAKHAMRFAFARWLAESARSLRKGRTAALPAAAPETEPQIALTHLTREYKAPVRETFAARLANWMPAPAMRPQPGFLPSVEPAGAQERIKALDGVSLELGEGITGLLGPNGAGKTTLLRLTAGIDQPTRGSVFICGHDMASQANRARACLSYLPQNFGVYRGVSAYKHLDYLALLRGVRGGREREALVLNALEQVNLRDHAHDRADHFSAGMKQRLGLAQLLLNTPKAIIVDEPTVGLDPSERIQFRNLLKQLSSGRAILFSTHLVEDIAHCCQNVAVLNGGKLLYHGGVREFAESARGAVWNIEAGGEAEWQSLRNRVFVASQKQTLEGRVAMRVLAPSPPDGRAEPLEPGLEDAYLYAIHVRNGG